MLALHLDQPQVSQVVHFASHATHRHWQSDVVQHAPYDIFGNRCRTPRVEHPQDPPPRFFALLLFKVYCPAAHGVASATGIIRPPR